MQENPAGLGSAYDSDEHEIREAARKIGLNPLLQCIYRDVYQRVLAEVPARDFPRLLELGSGGGFFKELAPHAVTSECFPTPGVERTVDACRIDEHFEASSLDAIVAFNVFHHLPDVRGFLGGASRVLRSGGRICMVEPWFTSIGQWFHRVIHHEPYRSDANDWRLVGEGRMAGANSRLPTSVFRDSEQRFQREFPDLTVLKRQPFHKWLYLASGGLKFNTRVPAPLARKLVALDRRIKLGDEALGLFCLLVVERR